MRVSANPSGSRPPGEQGLTCKAARERTEVEAALQSLFPGVSIILVAEDDSIPTHERRLQSNPFVENQR